MLWFCLSAAVASGLIYHYLSMPLALVAFPPLVIRETSDTWRPRVGVRGSGNSGRAGLVETCIGSSRPSWAPGASVLAVARRHSLAEPGSEAYRFDGRTAASEQARPASGTPSSLPALIRHTSVGADHVDAVLDRRNRSSAPIPLARPDRPPIGSRSWDLLKTMDVVHLRSERHRRPGAIAARLGLLLLDSEPS